MDSTSPALRTVQVTRYVTPLREGGSLPAIVEANDGFLYVLKFRGAGQGVKSLIAELVCGELARTLGFRVPELVFANLDPILSRTEGDEEIQDLIRASAGLNLGLHYLSGAITFDPLVNIVDAELASQIVWFDSLINNVDRTARNTNMLMWHKELWLIDHGAALYFHHAWQNWKENASKPFAQIKDHVLLRTATQLREADEKFHSVLTADKIQSIVSLIPKEWLLQDAPFTSAEEHRQAYAEFLLVRLAHSKIFSQEAHDARATSI
jgi:hypothetical protein